MNTNMDILMKEYNSNSGVANLTNINNQNINNNSLTQNQNQNLIRENSGGNNLNSNLNMNANLVDSCPKIRVAVRKRPLNKKEISRSEMDIIDIRSGNTVIVKELK